VYFNTFKRHVIVKLLLKYFYFFVIEDSKTPVLF